MANRLEVMVRQVSTTASNGAARGHSCLIDRPEAKGGTDRGPMGGELLLMGIGGCFLSNLLAAVREHGLTIADLTVQVSATLEQSPPRFADIVLLVASAHPDHRLLGELIARAEAECVSVNTARAATAVAVRLAR